MKILIAVILLFSCSKENQRMSDEVLLTVTSECNCSIKVYKMDSSQYLSTTYDCEYRRILPLKIERGTYMDITHHSLPLISEHSLPAFQSKVYHQVAGLIKVFQCKVYHSQVFFC